MCTQTAAAVPQPYGVPQAPMESQCAVHISLALLPSLLCWGCVQFTLGSRPKQAGNNTMNTENEEKAKKKVTAMAV